MLMYLMYVDESGGETLRMDQFDFVLSGIIRFRKSINGETS